MEHEEGMRRQLHHLHTSLESITKAKEDACQCLEAELGTLRLMLANAESTIAQLQEKVFISEAENLRGTELQVRDFNPNLPMLFITIICYSSCARML